jgi:hypothetical protein
MRVNLILAFLILSATLLTNALCHYQSGGGQTPSCSWENHSEGIALASTLTKLVKNGQEKHILRIYVKNVSQTVKEFIVSGHDGGLTFYTLSEAQAWVPLRDYGPSFYLGSATHEDLAPGETLYRDVELSPEEDSLVKAHSLKVRFTIYDLKTQLKSRIESEPRQLTEASG